MAETRSMARKPRRLVVIPNHPHHVILRGNNRRRVFSYPRDYRYFLFRLWQATERQGVAVHTSAQMSNHVHLIVTPPTQMALSNFVRGFAQPYAQFRNRRRSSSGKLFEERFKCIPIEGEEQMAVTTAYIALNPVRAGLCKNAADYRWSTFRQHAGITPRETLIDKIWSPSLWFLSLGNESAERSAAFLNCFEQYRARDDWEDVYNDPPLPNDRKRVERPDRRRAS